MSLLAGGDRSDGRSRLDRKDAPPDPAGVAEATIEKELGGAPEAVFGSFDPKPFASASIAQVHHARLHTGENVVVKIQRDGMPFPDLCTRRVLTMERLEGALLS
jgi:predicted unusual protein kinase regulating ubiquinone biosynthesis (AarF/ABC1/UbiB family)